MVYILSPQLPKKEKQFHEQVLRLRCSLWAAALDAANHRDKFRGEQGRWGLGQQKTVPPMQVCSGRSLGEREREAGHAAGPAQRPDAKDRQSPDEEYSDVQHRKRDRKCANPTIY